MLQKNPSARSEDEARDAIAACRPALYRLALLQLGDPAAAEDITQDALLTAIEKHHTFAGRAALKTWVISILRFKILDALRRRARHPKPTDAATLSRELDRAAVGHMFDETGRWATPNGTWPDPDGPVQQTQFFQMLEACMARLPPTMSRAFLMRAWLELSTTEICEVLDVSSGNLRVLLYRARMRLRGCIDLRWGRT